VRGEPGKVAERPPSAPSRYDPFCMREDHPGLVRRATSGDALAIGDLMQLHLPGLLAFVRANAGHRLRAREGTYDLVQSACREVLEDLSACSSLDENGFRRWLYLAAERKILDRARYHARQKRGAGREACTLSEIEVQALSQGYGDLVSPSRVAIAHEEIERLEAALARLSEPDRRVIVLSRIVGLPHAELARGMGTSEVNSRGALRRALARLSIELGAGGSARG